MNYILKPLRFCVRKTVTKTDLFESLAVPVLLLAVFATVERISSGRPPL